MLTDYPVESHIRPSEIVAMADVSSLATGNRSRADFVFCIMAKSPLMKPATDQDSCSVVLEDLSEYFTAVPLAFAEAVARAKEIVSAGDGDYIDLDLPE